MSAATTRKAQSDLRNAQRERDTLTARLEAREAQAKLDVFEQEDRVTEEFGQVLDPHEWLSIGFDEEFMHHGHRGAPPGAGARISDRQGGQNWPFFRNEIELQWLRGASRLLAGHVETARSVLDNLKNYTLGQGFEYKAKPDADAVEQPPEGLVDAVNRIVKEFREDNKWDGKRDREFLERSRRDGETFLGLWHIGGGHVQARFIEPEQVSEPGHTRALEDWIAEFAPDTVANPSCWRFGIHTPEDDVETVFGYHVTWTHNPQDWDYLPASRVEHMKLNVDGAIKRGMSDFFPVRKHMQAADTLITNMMVGSSASAAIAWIRQFAPGAGKSSIQSQVTSESMKRKTVQYQTGAKTENFKHHTPGTELNVTAGMEYKPGPMGSQRNPAFVAALQAGLRGVGTRWSMPESMISGDASNANFASALVAEGPFVKSIEAKQHDYILAFKSILWKVIRIAFEAGRLDGFNLDLAVIRHMIELVIEPPRVAVRDRDKETARSEILKKNGILSKETWAEQEGLDHKQEIANGAEEDPDVSLGLPGPGSPQSAAAALRQPTADRPRTKAITEAVAKVLESVETPAEARAVLREAVYP